MARLVGVVAVAVALWAMTHRVLDDVSRDAAAMSAASAEVDATDSSDPDADDDGVADDAIRPPEVPLALGYVGAAPEPRFFNTLDVASWASGLYQVGPSSDPAVAAADRDLLPRDSMLIVDERLNGDVFGGTAGVQQGNIRPGLYSTDFGVEDCSYRLWHVERDTRAETIIGEEFLPSGRLLVSINAIEPDWFAASPSCGEWYRWRPRPEPTAPVGNGDYWVGDLALGRWLVPENCLWENTVAFRGAQLRDVRSSGRGPALIEITDVPLGLRVRNCNEPITYIG
ncbi:MAG: hypothetical protein AAGD35_10710 [Actinomycetota bacterium]